MSLLDLFRTEKRFKEDEYPKTKEKTETIDATYHKFTVKIQFVSGRTEKVKHEGITVFDGGELKVAKINPENAYASTYALGNNLHVRFKRDYKDRSINYKNVEEFEVIEKEDVTVELKIKKQLKKKIEYCSWNITDKEILDRKILMKDDSE